MEGKKHDLHLRILLPCIKSSQMESPSQGGPRRISWWLILCEGTRAKVPNNVTLQLGRSSSPSSLVVWDAGRRGLACAGNSYAAVVCGQCLLTLCSCIAHLVDMQGHTPTCIR
jgi:hypothetical protein